MTTENLVHDASPRVVLLHQQFGPYHVARAFALERRLPGRVSFVQLASREEAREWQVHGSTPEILTVADGALEGLPETRLARRMTGVLDELRPEAVVIAGYAHAAMRTAARWARRNDARTILLSDSHQSDRQRYRLKELAKRAWVSHHFDAAFTAGALSAGYAQSLGIPASRIWRGYDVVDNEFFACSAAEARTSGSMLLSELGLPEHVFLYVGRFSPEKNLGRLLDAFFQYRDQAGAAAWGLLLVGNGPEADQLARRARKARGVALAGFRNGKALAEAYASASALILASLSEPWGLVVNEAMACGLPVLVSERAGAAMDLVFPGINGYIFNPERTEEMVQAMLRIASNRVDRRAMSAASMRIIDNFTPDTWATSLADCVDVVLNHRRQGH